MECVSTQPESVRTFRFAPKYASRKRLTQRGISYWVLEGHVAVSVCVCQCWAGRANCRRIHEEKK